MLRGMGTCMDAYSMDHMLDWEESEENTDNYVMLLALGLLKNGAT